jgi:cytochrome c
MNAPRRATLILLAGVGIVACCSVLIHPFGPVKEHEKKHEPAPLLTGAVINAGTRETIDRACQNCHSGNTEWPWYSYVAPVSWKIERDVSRGRAALDLSHWQEYPAARRLVLLEGLPTVIRTRVMPVPGYVLLHREARLSESDIDDLSRWAESERARLQSVAPAGSSR